VYININGDLVWASLFQKRLRFPCANILRTGNFFAVAAKILIVVRMLQNRQIVQFALFSRKLGLLYTDEISYATPDKRGFCGENGIKVVVFGNVIYHCGLIF